MRHLTFIFSFFLSLQIIGQELANAEIKNLQGQTINTSTLKNNDGPLVISFWATWCKPCINELNAFHDYFIDLEETGIKVLAISIDDSRTMSKVAPFVASQAWDYDVFLDPNSDFRRAMGVNNIPHTFLLNSKAEIVWQANKYIPGEEEELAKKIITLSKKEIIKND
jgi:peroxiredoxin